MQCGKLLGSVLKKVMSLFKKIYNEIEASFINSLPELIVGNVCKSSFRRLAEVTKVFSPCARCVNGEEEEEDAKGVDNDDGRCGPLP